MSNRLQHDTTTIRLLPLIDDYSPYYSDPDYGFDPYWDANCYNQHHLYFYRNFNKPSHVIEPDSYDIDKALNVGLAQARVDPWQNDTPPKCQMTYNGPDNEFPRVRTTSLSGYSSCRALREHSNHEDWRARICTADNQSWP